MAFRFEVQLLGLCHFIENETTKEEPVRHLCVLLPDLWDREGFGAGHQSRLIYDQSRLARAPVDDHSLRMRELYRERVTFRYFYEGDRPGSERPGRGLNGSYGQTIEMGRLLGDCSKARADVVSNIPPDIVSVQVLFDRGEVSPSVERNGPQWRVPFGLGASEETVATPEHVLISEAGLEAVEVFIEKFPLPGEAVGGVSEILRFDRGTDPITLTFTADCQLAVGALRLRRPLESDEPDADFAAHYLFLSVDDQKRLKAGRRKVANADSPDAVRDSPDIEEPFPLPIQVARKRKPADAKAKADFEMFPLSGHVIKIDGTLLSRAVGFQEHGGGASDCQNCQGCKRPLTEVESYFWPRRSGFGK